MKQTWKKIAYTIGALAVAGFLLVIFGMREINENKTTEETVAKQSGEIGYTIEQTKYWTKIETLMLSWDRESRNMMDVFAKEELAEDADIDMYLDALNDLEPILDRLIELSEEASAVTPPSEYTQLHEEYTAVLEEYAFFLNDVKTAVQGLDLKWMSELSTAGIEIDARYEAIQEEMRLQRIESHKFKHDGI